MPIILSDNIDKAEYADMNYLLVALTDKTNKGQLYKPLAITEKMVEYLVSANNPVMCRAVVENFLKTPRAKRAFKVIKILSEYNNIFCLCDRIGAVNLFELYSNAFNANGVEVVIYDE